jgi:hypothetical protein
MIRPFALALALGAVAGCGEQATRGIDAQAGDEAGPSKGTETHGGDKLASLFIAKGYRIFDHLSALGPEEAILMPQELDALLEALRTTRVDPVDHPLTDSAGDVVEARTSDDPLHPGRKLIELDRARWETSFSRGADVYRLVFHEYLWALGLDDGNYRLSNRLRLVDTPMDGLGGWQALAELNAPFVELGDEAHDAFVAWSAKRLVTIAGGAARSCLSDFELNTYDATTGIWSKPVKPADFQLGVGFGAAADSEVVVAFGGLCGESKAYGIVEHRADGFIFSPASQTFTQLPKSKLAGRSQPVMAAGGGHVMVWGGIDASGDRSDGAILDRAGGEWRMLPAENAPAIGPHRAVFANGVFVMWRLDARACATPIKLYDPGLGVWGDVASRSAPEFTCDWKAATWTGDRFAFVFDYPQTAKDGAAVAGAFWNPLTDEWAMIPSEGGPGFRSGATTVWMGDKLVVFGGRNFDGIAVNLGSVYFPSTRVWRPLRWEGAPLARYKHVAFWTEHGMLVWGGRSVLDTAMRSGAIWAF